MVLHSLLHGLVVYAVNAIMGFCNCVAPISGEKMHIASKRIAVVQSGGGEA